MVKITKFLLKNWPRYIKKSIFFIFIWKVRFLVNNFFPPIEKVNIYQIGNSNGEKKAGQLIDNWFLIEIE